MDVVDDDRPEDEPGFDVLTEWRLVEGNEVVDRVGESLGAVLAFVPPEPEDGRPDFIVIEEGLIRRQRLYVPVAAIAGLRGDVLYLNVSEAEAKERGWDRPPQGIELSIE